VRGVLVLALLILAEPLLAGAQGGQSIENQPIQMVNFCDLTKHPNQYDGKTVEVTATYASDLESAIFFDDNCKKSESQPDVIARATFLGNRDEVKRSMRQLRKVFNKRFVAPHVATVTMIAIFRDSYPPPEICSCPRYTLEVRRFIAAQKIKPPEATPQD